MSTTTICFKFELHDVCRLDLQTWGGKDSWQGSVEAISLPAAAHVLHHGQAGGAAVHGAARVQQRPS
jgi:hypothetical protein